MYSTLVCCTRYPILFRLSISLYLLAFVIKSCIRPRNSSVHGSIVHCALGIVTGFLYDDSALFFFLISVVSSLPHYLITHINYNMHTIADFCVIPMGVTASVRDYVAECQRVIEKSGNDSCVACVSRVCVC